MGKGKHASTSDEDTREWTPEDVALIAWHNAKSKPEKIRAIAGIFEIDPDEAPRSALDEADRAMSEGLMSTLNAAATEYETAGREPDNFDRATKLDAQLRAKVSPTAEAVWNMVETMGKILDEEGL